MQPSQSAFHILQQTEEIHKLTEELNKCNNDKKFVWGLWKKLQKSNPDLNAAVEQVVQREKDQNEQKINSLVNCSNEKDEQVKLLSTKLENFTRDCEQIQSQLEAERMKNEKLNETVSDLTNQLSCAKKEIIDYTALIQATQLLEEEKITLKDTLEKNNLENNEKKREIEDLNFKVDSLNALNDELTRNIQMKEEEHIYLIDSLDKFKIDLHLVSNECHEQIVVTTKLHEELRQKTLELNIKENSLSYLQDETNTIQISLANVTEELKESNNQNTELKSNLLYLENTLVALESDLRTEKDTVTKLNREILSLELNKEKYTQENEKNEQIKKETKSISTQINNHRVEIQVAAAADNIDDDDDKCQSVLSVREKCSTYEVINDLLQAKTLELDQIKVSHDRRFQRYKEIRNAYKLLKQQLSTYQPDAIAAPIVLESHQRQLNDISAKSFTYNAAKSSVDRVENALEVRAIRITLN